MKKMDFEQMENLQGGSCDALNSKAVKTVELVACVGSFCGPIGALIFGPTALGLAIGEYICS